MNLHFFNLIGWAAMLLLAWGISSHRRRFPWRTVLWGLGLQFALAVLILTRREASVRWRRNAGARWPRWVFGP